MLLDVKKLMEEIESKHYNDLIMSSAAYGLFGYVADAIQEIADHNVDIYYDDLWLWAQHNTDSVEDTLDVHGFECGQSLTDVFALAQFTENEQYIYDYLDDFISYALFSGLMDLDIEYIPEEAIFYIEDNLVRDDEQFDNLFKYLIDYIEDVNSQALFDAALDMPSGWYVSFGVDMVEELIDILIKNDSLVNYTVFEVKEKFGGLRWYGGGFLDEIPEAYWAWLDKYEKLSEITCQQCGSPVDKGEPLCKYCAIEWSDFYRMPKGED